MVAWLAFPFGERRKAVRFSCHKRRLVLVPGVFPKRFSIVAYCFEGMSDPRGAGEEPFGGFPPKPAHRLHRVSKSDGVRS